MLLSTNPYMRKKKLNQQLVVNSLKGTTAAATPTTPAPTTAKTTLAPTATPPQAAVAPPKPTTAATALSGTTGAVRGYGTTANPEGASQDTGGPNANQQSGSYSAAQSNYQNSRDQLIKSYEGMKAQIQNDPNLNDTQKQISLQALEKEHYNRLKTLDADWERKGQYEQSNQELMDKLLAGLNGSNVNINDPTSAQANTAYRNAIAALQGGESVESVYARLKGELPASYNFSITGSTLNQTNPTYGGVTTTNLPNITQGTATATDPTKIAGTDTSALTQAGSEAEKLQLEELKKILAGGAVNADELNAAMQPEQDAATRALLGQLSARGFGTNVGAVSGGMADIAAKYAAQRAQNRYNAAQTNAAAKAEAIGKLGEVSQSQRNAAIEAAKIASGEKVAGAQIESTEKRAFSDQKLAYDTLYQEGQLTKAGLEVKQNLEAAGLDLEKYKTDKGYNLDQARLDYEERLAQSGLDVESAKLQADNVFKGIEAAQNTVKINQNTEATIANLELQAAQGDQDAGYKVQALRVSQDLQQQGIDNDVAMFVADLQYRLMSGREQLDQDMKQFLLTLDAQLKAQKGSGLGGFLGTLVGGLAGSITGGAGTAIGSAIGNALS